MDTSLFLQYMVIAVAVIASAAFVFRSRFPRAARAFRLRVAAWLLRANRPGWLQQMGRRLAPAATASAGCGGCNGCG